MTKIIMNISPISIPHIEVLVSLGHGMNLRDMGNHMDTFCCLAGMVYQNKSVIDYLRPLGGNAVQIPSLGKELTCHGVGRDNNLSLLIML